MRNSNASNVKSLCLAGLFIAFVCLATMFFYVRVPATEGYIHFGDGFILIISIMFGKKYGFIAGGVGSALADIFLGAPHWALFTFFIKGFMGYTAGTIKDYCNENSDFFSFKNTLAAFAAEFIMILGYFFFAIILKGFFMTPETDFISSVQYGVVQAASSVVQNSIQGVGGVIVFHILGFALHNVKIVRFAK